MEQVELSDTAQGKLLSLQFSQPPAALKAFALGSPPRVVIDVEGPFRSLASAKYAARDSLIERVRVGFHKEHIRFVLDLKKNLIPPFAVEQKQDRVVANLQVSGQLATDAPAQLLFSRSGATRNTRIVAKSTRANQTERLAAPATPTPRPTVQTAQTSERTPPPLSPSQPVAAPRLSVSPARPSAQAGASQSAGPSAQADRRAPIPRVLSRASLLRLAPSSQTTQQAYSLLNPSPVPPSSTSAGRQPAAPALSTSLPQTPVMPAQQARQPHRQLAALSPKDALSQSAKKVPAVPSLSSEARRHLGKGQILYDQGKVAEAIVEWRETARLAPNNAKAYHLLGLALQDQDKTEEAISKLRTSVRLDPQNATAYVHLAQALESRGDTKKALSAYNEALKLVPTSAHVHNRLGHLLASQGDWQGAAEKWKQTTELQPDYAYAYANLGEALEQIEQKKEALEAYKQAVTLKPAAPFAAEVRKRIVRLSTDEI